MVPDLLARVQASAAAEALRDSLWLYPLVNTVHVLGVGLLFGMIVAADLRLLGLSSKSLPADALLGHTLPWVWTGFVVAAVSGALLFAADAVGLAGNPFLWVKLAVIGAAGANALALHRLGGAATGSAAAKAAAGASILLWTGAIGLGRWIAYY